MADAESRRVYFLDTPDLTLYHGGVVARVRDNDHKPDDSVVKLRPFIPTDIPGALRRSRHFSVEVDVMPGNYVCSGSLKARLAQDVVDRTVAEGRPLRSLFTPEQRALLVSFAPIPVEIDQLLIFGPVHVRKARLLLEKVRRSLAVEWWTYPDGSRVLELSTRCPVDEAVRVAAQMADLLVSCGVDLDSPQQTKTSATLEFFRRIYESSPTT